MLPRDVTIATVEGELQSLHSYAARHGWAASWAPEKLLLSIEGTHAGARTKALLLGDVTDYRALPPRWTFGPIPGGDSSTSVFPEGGPVTGGISSIFHGNGIICAPFNRLAYKGHGGPHDDWNGPANWLKVTGKVTAKTLADMLAEIVLHLKYSPGWKK